MSEWQPLSALPPHQVGIGHRVIVFAPNIRDNGPVFEARLESDGSFEDPHYDRWSGSGATHWMPLPEPPDGVSVPLEQIRDDIGCEAI
jgi:hypothetical protein